MATLCIRLPLLDANRRRLRLWCWQGHVTNVCGQYSHSPFDVMQRRSSAQLNRSR